MLRRLVLGCCLSIGTSAMAHAADATPAMRPQLTASAIVDKNIAARGGLQAWRAVHTMSLQGKMGAGGNKRASLKVPGATSAADKDALAARPDEEVYLPFVMDLKRPRKMRLELQFNRQTAVQVYDGTNGWKLRPFLNRRVVEPYTDEEIKLASVQADLDGPLTDYAGKGSTVELAGMEKVEGRDTYKIKLTLKNGQSQSIWIDAETFLESKMEGQPRRLDGFEHPVEVYFRDFRTVGGLKVPFLLETKVLPLTKTAMGLADPVVPSEKAIVERVTINPSLEDAMFAKPQVEMASAAH